MKFLIALKRHKWRYLAFLGGFVLFVYPSALLIRAAFFIQGNTATPGMHQICYRMPFDWLSSGSFDSFAGRTFLVGFLGTVLVTAFLFGPLFCGWLCPVGAFSELVSKPVPRKFKIDLTKKMNPAALRFGFLAAFVIVSAMAVFVPSLGLASICCRYCASSQLQMLATGIFSGGSLSYWASGSIMALGGWLIIGGIFWQGGRGWCLYGCPLGAVSNVLHFIGSKLDFTYKIKHEATNCSECGECEKVCPSWAINRVGKDVSINLGTCNSCLECVKVCTKRCFSYTRGSL